MVSSRAGPLPTWEGREFRGAGGVALGSLVLPEGALTFSLPLQRSVRPATGRTAARLRGLVTWETRPALAPGPQPAAGPARWHSRPRWPRGMESPAPLPSLLGLSPASRTPLRSLKEASWGSFLGAACPVLMAAASPSPFQGIQGCLGPAVRTGSLHCALTLGLSVSLFQLTSWREW